MKTIIYWAVGNRKGYPPSPNPRFRLVVDPARLIDPGAAGFSAALGTPPGVEVESTDGNGDPCWVHARDAKQVDEIMRRAIAKIATAPTAITLDNGRLVIDLGVL